MRMKKGFERLRGVAAAGAMGLGALMGGGSVRASSSPTGPSASSLSMSVTYGTRWAYWSGFSNLNYAFGGATVTTTNGKSFAGNAQNFGIYDASIGFSNTLGTTATKTHAFDRTLSLAVDGTMFVNPDGFVDVTGNTATSNPVTGIVSGLDATVQYWFDPDRTVVRALYTLTNTTAADITANALVAGNFGSDTNTTVEASQSGDTVADATDRWFVTDDGSVGVTPVITTTRYGSGASVVPSAALTPGAGSDNYGMRYTVTVPANSTRRVMVFQELGQSAAANTAAATDFESLAALDAAGLLAGLTAEQQAEIVNYGSGGNSNSNSNSNSSSGGGGGAFGWLSLLGGLLLFRRRT